MSEPDDPSQIAPWPTDPLPLIRARAARTVVALDDDPTGTQTVRDATVLTRWDTQDLRDVLTQRLPVVFILTNSRSLPSEQARALALRLGRQLRAAADETGRDWSVISRSDSTLRGHFPVEVDALADGLAIPDARVLLAPFLGDAGRVTIGGVHHVRRDDTLVPVAETEFARDPVFGYRSSDLATWVVERTRGSPRPVSGIALRGLRSNGPEAVRDALVALPPRGVLVVDAVEERDIEVAALGAVLAEEAGVPLIARTAGSFVRARAGQPPATPVEPSAICSGGPGLVVVGSHVPTTSGQLMRLLADPPVPIVPIEIDARALVADPASSERTAASVAATADRAIGTGATPVIHTSRAIVRGLDPDGDLGIAALVSSTLVASVAALATRPGWVIAKGGITSSDIATRALGVTRAHVVGPLMAGVPLWRLDDRSRWPGLSFLVFPGNVGGPDAVRHAVALLAGAEA